MVMCLAEVERCFNKGLLQKRGPSIDLARKSLIKNIPLDNNKINKSNEEYL